MFWSHLLVLIQFRQVWQLRADLAIYDSSVYKLLFFIGVFLFLSNFPPNIRVCSSSSSNSNPSSSSLHLLFFFSSFSFVFDNMSSAGSRVNRRSNNENGRAIYGSVSSGFKGQIRKCQCGEFLVMKTVTDMTNLNYGKKFWDVEIGGTDLIVAATIFNFLLMMIMVMLMNVI